MLIPPNSSVRNSPAPTAIGSNSTQSSPQMDFQNFLRLLTAQLRYQDPLSPTESTQFVTQLASFSTVEQLVNANSKLDAIGDRLSSAGVSEFGHLIGKIAEARVPVPDLSASIPFRLEPAPAAEEADLVIRDSNGVEVARAHVQNSDYIQIWPGMAANSSTASGPYVFSAEFFSDGQLVRAAPVSTFSSIQEIRTVGTGVAARLATGVDIEIADILGLGE